MSSHYYISIPTQSGENQHFEVQKEVYIYVQQLELKIMRVEQPDLYNKIVEEIKKQPDFYGE